MITVEQLQIRTTKLRKSPTSTCGMVPYFRGISEPIVTSIPVANSWVAGFCDSSANLRRGREGYVWGDLYFNLVYGDTDREFWRLPVLGGTAMLLAHEVSIQAPRSFSAVPDAILDVVRTRGGGQATYESFKSYPVTNGAFGINSADKRPNDDVTIFRGVSPGEDPGEYIMKKSVFRKGLQADAKLWYLELPGDKRLHFTPLELALERQFPLQVILGGPALVSSIDNSDRWSTHRDAEENRMPAVSDLNMMFNVVVVWGRYTQILPPCSAYMLTPDCRVISGGDTARHGETLPLEEKDDDGGDDDDDADEKFDQIRRATCCNGLTMMVTTTPSTREQLQRWNISHSSRGSFHAEQALNGRKVIVSTQDKLLYHNQILLRQDET
ncbi:hypothetical protein PG996_000188 [Apiospora saccharicola]|uniref:Uncharacterized protein n=1 Tax=Apiospora saccharicola TaxID=335842 RepID=A0ABR1WD16_9PEZI